MKYKNSLLIVVMLLFVACTNHDMEEIIVPTEGYIYFNTEVSSRGTLVVNDLQGKDFAVTGYKYTGDWNTVKVHAKPDGLLYMEKIFKKQYHCDIQVNCSDMVDSGNLVIRLEFYNPDSSSFFYLYFNEDKFYENIEKYKNIAENDYKTN